MTIKAGVKKDGTLTALQMTVLGTGGAYPGGGVGGVDCGRPRPLHLPERARPS